MKMIRDCVLREHKNSEIVKTYFNVAFPRGFSKFILALETGKLLEDSKGKKINEGYVWGESKDKIQITTSSHPLLPKNSLIESMKISGTPVDIEQVECLMERYDVSFYDLPKERKKEFVVKYKKILNPALWEDDNTLKKEVLVRLNKIADKFLEYLELPDLKIQDYVMTGSNANFTWSKFSDIDLHILVDMEDAKKRYGKIVDEFFNVKRLYWNSQHEIKIFGFDVELYVESGEDHVSSGVYSLKKNKWLVKPEPKNISIHDSDVLRKAEALMSEIDNAIHLNKLDAIERVINKIAKIRKCGLQSAGELSVENLAFKVLRNSGYLAKLRECKLKLLDRKLSIEEEELLKSFVK